MLLEPPIPTHLSQEDSRARIAYGYFGGRGTFAPQQCLKGLDELKERGRRRVVDALQGVLEPDNSDSMGFSRELKPRSHI